MKVFKEKLWDYLLLSVRVLLAWTMIRYGYGKLTAGQFGVSEATLSTPLNELSLFDIAWYLFDHEPFKSFIGISQVMCGLLFLFHRTVLLGAFLFLPIVINILVIDMTIMGEMGQAFTWRLSFYMLLDLLIFYQHLDRMKIIWKAVWERMNTKYNIPWWTYVLLPVSVIGLEILGALPKVIYLFVTNPSETIKALNKTIELLSQHIFGLFKY